MVDSYEKFVEYCLRKLGSPMIDINVDQSQIEDRVQDALQYFSEYHFNGVERVYLKHQITAEEAEGRFINTSELVTSVYKVHNVSYSTAESLFNLEYHLKLDTVFDLTSTQMLDYTLAMQHYQMIGNILGSDPKGGTSFTFNKHVNKIFIDTEVNEGDFVLVECYRSLDPAEFTDVWNDMFMKRYATALIKQQWGANLIKFDNVQLPGGLTLDGNKIFEQATAEIEAIEQQVTSKYEDPIDFFVG